MCDVPRTKESYAGLAKQVRDALVRFNNCLSALKPPGLKCTCLLAQSPIQTLNPKAETPKHLYTTPHNPYVQLRTHFKKQSKPKAKAATAKQEPPEE